MQIVFLIIVMRQRRKEIRRVGRFGIFRRKAPQHRRADPDDRFGRHGRNQLFVKRLVIGVLQGKQRVVQRPCLYIRHGKPSLTV